MNKLEIKHKTSWGERVKFYGIYKVTIQKLQFIISTQSLNLKLNRIPKKPQFAAIKTSFDTKGIY